VKTEYLFLRRLPLHYVAPPVCDGDFTGTGEPSIALSAHPRFKVTGLFVQTTGTGFRLVWGTVDGGLCYNVYQLIGTEWTLIGECISDNFFDVPDGVYSITVITREGESELSDPINTSAPGAGPAPTMTVVADVPETYEVDDEPGAFRFIRNGPLAGNFFARFVLSGTATFGASDDYSLTATTTLNNVGGNVWEIFMPDSVAEVFMYVEGRFDETVESDETVIVSLQPTVHYAVGFPDVATVTIKEGCPPETGTDTPCDLGTPENVFLGTKTIASGPSGLVTSPWGTFPLGDYKATYDGGAYKFDGNPDPGDFRIQQYKVLFPTGSAQYWDQNGDCNDPAIAGVEACVPIGKSLTKAGQEGQVSLQFDGLGTGADYPGGGSDPTFSLYRTKIYPELPTQIRIKDFDAADFDQCPDFVPSASTPWSGTFPAREISPPFTYFWQENNPTAFSFNGQELTFARVDHFTSHPSSGTGCGWRVFLEVGKTIAPFFTAPWVGFKGVGNTPVGVYYRDSGCSVGPECLVIEAY